MAQAKRRLWNGREPGYILGSLVLVPRARSGPSSSAWRTAPRHRVHASKSDASMASLREQRAFWFHPQVYRDGFASPQMA